MCTVFHSADFIHSQWWVCAWSTFSVPGHI